MNRFDNIYQFDSLPSTNTYAKEQKDSLPDCCVVTARRQTAGKGRLGRSWTDLSEGSLCASFFVRDPGFDVSLLPLASALAASRAVKNVTGLTPLVKWPNDLIVSKRKLCGILCESILGAKTGCVVSGIGINVNQPADIMREAGLAYATSLFEETGRMWEIPLLLEALVHCFEAVLAEWERDGFDKLLQEYTNLLLNLGRQVRVLYQNKTRTAAAVGVAENGSLICRDESGEFLVTSGEASVRGLYGYTE